MNTIRLYWNYLRNTVIILLILLPFFIAAWVFYLAIGIDGGGVWMGIMGAAAVLLLFRKGWRQWVILFRQFWGLARRLVPDLWRVIGGRIRAGSRIRAGR